MLRKNFLSTVLFAGLASPAMATVVTSPDPAQFSISEIPGQYTVNNASSNWYIYAFDVSNPAASLGGDSTTQPNWLAYDSIDVFPINRAEWVYGYTNINNASTSPSDLANDIGPNSSSNKFLFPVSLASDYLIYVTDTNGDTAMITGVTNISSTPLPAALPMFAGGLGFVGYLSRRKKRNTSARAA